MKYFLVALFLFSVAFLPNAYAQGGAITPDNVTIMKAQVLKVIATSTEDVTGTVSMPEENLEVQILDGAEAGKTVSVLDDRAPLAAGDILYLTHTSGTYDGTDYYSVDEPYRLPQVGIFVLIFIAVVILFGGWQGLRGLLALAGSFLLIAYVLLPGILHGFSPVLVTFGVSALIIILGSYVTHGFNKTTSTAVIGMIATVIITGILASIAVHVTKLTGYNTEEATYLTFDTNGSINVLGLLLGGMVIGLLGVLYDAAISQAIVVEELILAAPDMPKRKVFERALRIGREHIGALVNTIAIAYAGVSLPLLLLFYLSPNINLGEMVNKEIFSAEIIRILVGSIGLVLAVPITTLISVWMLKKGDLTHLHSHDILTRDL